MTDVMNAAVSEPKDKSPVEETEFYEPVVFLEDNQCYQQISVENLEEKSSPEIEVSLLDTKMGSI